MKHRITIDYTHDGRPHVMLFFEDIHYGFHHEADDVKTCLNKCYANALNYLWTLKVCKNLKPNSKNVRSLQSTRTNGPHSGK